jgi:uncharacterized membrane protein YfbV (UPF0208 family)
MSGKGKLVIGLAAGAVVGVLCGAAVTSWLMQKRASETPVVPRERGPVDQAARSVGETPENIREHMPRGFDTSFIANEESATKRDLASRVVRPRDEVVAQQLGLIGAGQTCEDIDPAKAQQRLSDVRTELKSIRAEQSGLYRKLGHAKKAATTNDAAVVKWRKEISEKSRRLADMIKAKPEVKERLDRADELREEHKQLNKRMMVIRGKLGQSARAKKQGGAGALSDEEEKKLWEENEKAIARIKACVEELRTTVMDGERARAQVEKTDPAYRALAQEIQETRYQLARRVSNLPDVRAAEAAYRTKKREGDVLLWKQRELNRILKDLNDANKGVQTHSSKKNEGEG